MHLVALYLIRIGFKRPSKLKTNNSFIFYLCLIFKVEKFEWHKYLVFFK